MSWYALQHKPAQGDRAVEHLQNQDIRCFYPKVEVEKIRAGKWVRRLEPLFPGYVFVNLTPNDPMWSKLRSTRGVLRIVGFGGKPAPIDDAVIAHLRDSLHLLAGQGGICEGQPVTLEDGPFKGLSAVFQAYDGEARAIVLIQFMQSQQRVKVPLTALKTG